MHSLIQDIRYGLRSLLKRPAFTAVAVLCLALGIGANSTIFTWVNAILMNPIPGVAEPGRLVVLYGTDRNGDDISFSYPDYVDLRDRSDLFEGILVQDMQGMSLGSGDRPERIYGMIVSGNFFDVLGVRPILGRGFLPEEDKTPGTHPVAVISYGLWQRHFGGADDVIGKTTTINNHPFTIIGVAPEVFQGTETALAFDVWVPMMMQHEVISRTDRLEARWNHWLDAYGRLKPGVSIEQAQAQLNTISAQLEQEYTDIHAEQHIALFPLWQSPLGAQRILGPILLIMMAVVGAVLLIACANVANLLLARAAGRRREMAIRNALGASRGRIVRQLLTESVILAVAAGTLGLLMAVWSDDLFMAFAPPIEYNIQLPVSVDMTVLGFTLGVSVLTGIIFGLAPAWQASRTNAAPALKDEVGTVAGGAARSRLRNTLVVGQIALSLVLLITAGLFLKSLQKANLLNPGFNQKQALVATLDLYPSGYTLETGQVFLAQLYDRLQTIPGVDKATLGRRVPLGLGGRSSTSITVEGYDPPPETNAWSFYNQVGPGYFDMMEIPLVKGRDIQRQDTPETQKVTVVNETFARRYWPEKDAVGQRVQFGQTWYTVVGVVRDTKYHNLNERPIPYMFLPVLQSYRSDTNIQVRSTLSPPALEALIREEIRKLDPTLPIYNVRTMEEQISSASMPQRLGGVFLSIFGMLALALAAVGIGSMLAYTVSQRTREIGVRMALGAGSGNITAMILRQGLTMTGIGIGIGLAVSFGITRFMSSLLYEVSAVDPVIFGGIALLLAVVAFLACYIPAYRATRVDPMTALRCE